MRTSMVLGLVAVLGAPVVWAGAEPLADAQAAYAAKDYGKARELAKAHTGAADAKTKLKAWKMVAASSCMLKDRAGALDAAAHLGGDVELIMNACGAAGVPVTKDEALIAASPGRAAALEAEKAYAAGKFADAKKAGLAAVEKDPKLTPAWRLIGLSACKVKDKQTAQKAIEHMKDVVDVEIIRKTCFGLLGSPSRPYR